MKTAIDEQGALLGWIFIGSVFLLTLTPILDFCIHYCAQYERYQTRNEAGNIYEIKNNITRTKQILAYNKLRLEQEKNSSNKNFIVFGQGEFAAYLQLIEEDENSLEYLVAQHNKWQLCHNGFLIGTSEFEKLLLNNDNV